VISDPAVVGAQSATLTLSFRLPENIPPGGTIKVTVPPSEAKFDQGDEVPCQIKGAIDIIQTCATNGPQVISFVLPSIGVPLFADGFYDLTFKGVFYAPLSSNPTEPFKVEMSAPTSGEILVTDNGDMRLSGLETATIQSASTAQVNSVIVAKPTAVAFSVTTLNPIPESGGIQIRLPKWNPRANSRVRESFVLDDITFDREGSTETLPDSDIVINEDDVAIDYSRLCSPKSVSVL
jgi:hypothetical protein